uniref:Transmembrane protein n=1 Tax=Cacopsylla melanoneura TaxID=428564 RepID=A0A8D8WYZ7_9HEMI
MEDPNTELQYKHNPTMTITAISIMSKTQSTVARTVLSGVGGSGVVDGTGVVDGIGVVVVVMGVVVFGIGVVVVVMGVVVVDGIGVLLSHTRHDTLVTGSSDDGGEDSSGKV